MYNYADLIQDSFREIWGYKSGFARWPHRLLKKPHLKPSDLVHSLGSLRPRRLAGSLTPFLNEHPSCHQYHSSFVDGLPFLILGGGIGRVTTVNLSL